MSFYHFGCEKITNNKIYLSCSNAEGRKDKGRWFGRMATENNGTRMSKKKGWRMRKIQCEFLLILFVDTLITIVFLLHLNCRDSNSQADEERAN